MAYLDITSTTDSPTFDSDSVLITPAATWTQVGVVRVGHRTGYIGLVITTAVANVTAIKITRSLLTDGHDDGLESDLAVDTDLNTATTEIVNCLPTVALPLSAGSQIDLKILADGTREIGVYAKSGGTATVRMRGTLPGKLSEAL
jgi:hypothetical protein